jgi:hypothetical protein
VLASAGVDVEVVSLPEGMDLANVYQKGTDDSLEELLATAGAWVEGEEEVDSGEVPESQTAPPQEPSETVAQALVRIAQEQSELFTDTDSGAPYASIEVDGHVETYPLKGTAFKEWLSHCCYDSEGRVPTGSALRDSIGVLCGLARFSGESRKVHVRVARAEDGSRIWLDLGDPAWRAVEVTAKGWRVLERSPVKFRRPKGAWEIPAPERGGSIEDFFGLVNCAGKDVEARVKGWLLGALRGDGPFLILIAQGEHGAAKSFLCNLLRELIDPSKAGLRVPPTDERDMAIAASNSWVVSYDNLSGLPAWLSDSLCRIATGAGFATRALYTDSEEAIFSFSRPILLNGIDDVATRPDLADRSMAVHLEAIAPEDRKEVSRIRSEFERLRPGILGALLDAVAESMRRLPAVNLERLPRMADAARWIVAGEGAMGLEPGAFIRALEEGQGASQVAALEAHPVAGALMLWFAARGRKWRGSSGELLVELEDQVTDSSRRARGWPRSPAALAGKLRRLAPALREAGVAVTMGRGKTRWVQVDKAASAVPDFRHEREPGGDEGAAWEPGVEVREGVPF